MDLLIERRHPARHRHDKARHPDIGLVRPRVAKRQQSQSEVFFFHLVNRRGIGGKEGLQTFSFEFTMENREVGGVALSLKTLQIVALQQ